MASAGPTTLTEDTPCPNVALIHRPGESAAGAATLARPPLAVRKRVLVVDDEMPDCRGVDLLVTDLMMPQMNGRKLAAVVRKQYPWADDRLRTKFVRVLKRLRFA